MATTRNLSRSPSCAVLGAVRRYLKGGVSNVATGTGESPRKNSTASRPWLSVASAVIQSDVPGARSAPGDGQAIATNGESGSSSGSTASAEVARVTFPAASRASTSIAAAVGEATGGTVSVQR